jgi:hypothetical protein
LRRGSLSQVSLHLRPDIGHGALCRLGLLGQILGFTQLFRRDLGLRRFRLGRCARTAPAAGVVGFHTFVP